MLQCITASSIGQEKKAILYKGNFRLINDSFFIIFCNGKTIVEKCKFPKISTVFVFIYHTKREYYINFHREFF